MINWCACLITGLVPHELTFSTQYIIGILAPPTISYDGRTILTMIITLLSRDDRIPLTEARLLAMDTVAPSFQLRSIIIRPPTVTTPATATNVTTTIPIPLEVEWSFEDEELVELVLDVIRLNQDKLVLPSPTSSSSSSSSAQPVLTTPVVNVASS
jgi:hypothetical protein